MGSDLSTTVHYRNVSDKLIEHIPELREAYESELEWWGSEKPGPHVVYGDILSPYIDRLLQSGDEVALRHVFEFLELLSLSEDKLVKELVAVTVCEYLGNDKKMLFQAKHYMGPETLQISNEVEKFWNE